jgi:hypothetical protein
MVGWASTSMPYPAPRLILPVLGLDSKAHGRTGTWLVVFTMGLKYRCPGCSACAMAKSTMLMKECGCGSSH